jgi:hypothetical protein
MQLLSDAHEGSDVSQFKLSHAFPVLIELLIIL